MKRFLPILLFLCLLALPQRTCAQAAFDSDAPDCVAWVGRHFAPGRLPPFSFRYDGIPSDRFLKKWRYTRNDGPPQPDGARMTRHSWRDPRTGLEVTCAVKTFPDAEAMEWVLYFRGGKERTGQISDVRVVDLSLPAGPEAVIYHAEGSTAEKKDFHPRETVLQPGDTLRMKPYAGRSSSHAFPYFNVRTRDGGMVFAIGWTGTWKATLFRDAQDRIGVQTGMVFLDTWLEPGEEIRTPMTAMLSWRGDDRMRGQNALRRFIMAHHYPRIRGEKVAPPLCASFNFSDPPPCNVYSCFTTSYALALVERYRMFGLVPDVFWLDAGWYGPSARWQEGYNWCNTVGSWQVDSTRFPGGLGEIADAVHEAGSRFMVWFEPERVIKESDWAYRHPEYLLEAWGKKVEPHPIDRSYPDSYLLDLGNPEANRWMREEMARMVREGRIDHFRQDFNIEPEAFWYNNDAPGRLGIREIRYITGLYGFWDWMRAEFPDMFIDNCASGGRRLDLEATSRCLPLWRTDYDTLDPDICQSHTFGLSQWLPVHGTAVWRDDPYVARSSLAATTIFNWKVTSPESDIRRMHARMAEFEAVQDYFMDDFHPLLGDGDLTRDDILLAWQLDRPEDGTGWISVFRRPKAPQTEAQLHLKALDPKAVYEIEDWDSHTRVRKTGQALSDGFDVALPAPRTARLFRYRKVTGEALSVFQLNLWYSLTRTTLGREPLFAQLAALQPDIASFCELVTPGPSCPEGCDVETLLDDAAAYLKAHTGHTYYKTFLTQSGTRGILTRHPVVEEAQAVPHEGMEGDQDMFCRTVISFHGQEIAFYSSHSTPLYYGSYLPKGWGDGGAPYGWEKLPDGPVTDTDFILARERLSDRIRLGIDVTADAVRQEARGRLCLYAGDLNEPSHLDWTEATAGCFQHGGCVVPWPLSVYLAEHGWQDAWREQYPDPVRHPGFTWPVYNPDAVEATQWTTDADERERIDYIYYRRDPRMTLGSIRLVGPDACMAYGERTFDGFLDPEREWIPPTDGKWVSDHRGLYAVFEINHGQ